MMNLSTLQKTVAKLLKDCPVLVRHNVEPLAEDKGNIFADIKLALAKVSCCAVVLSPRFKSSATDAQKPLGAATLVVQIFEMPALNRGKANRLTALNAAEAVAVFLHHRPVVTVANKEVTRLVFDEFYTETAGGALAVNVVFKTGKFELNSNPQEN